MLLVPDPKAEKDDCHSYLESPALPGSPRDVAWKEAPPSILDNLLVEGSLCNVSQEFSRSPVQVSRGVEIVSVIQGEVAVAQPENGPSALGSDSATTCHIVGIRDPLSGVTCLAHLDNWETAALSSKNMLDLLSKAKGQAPTAPLDLYIVGGYLGEPLAEKLSRTLLSALHASPQVFRLILACISGVNSRPVATGDSEKIPRGDPGGSVPIDLGDGPWPSGGPDGSMIHEGGDNGADSGRRAEMVRSGSEAARGAESRTDSWLPRQTSLAIDIETGRAFPVRFDGAGRGPGWEIRHLRLFGSPRGDPLSVVYDARTDSIVVMPFPLWMDRASVVSLLRLPDKELLALTSTSPDAEDPRFVQDMRAQLSFLLDKIGPHGMDWWENVFGGGRGKILTFPRAGQGASLADAN